MQGKTKRMIQVALLAAFVLAAIRLVMVFHERKDEGPVKTAQHGVDTGLSADAYVVPKRLHAYDLKSAKQLVGKPIWVREGYRSTIYPAPGGKVDFGHEAGMLLPIERIVVKDVRLAPSPASSKSAASQQVVLLFERDGKEFGAPIGLLTGKDYSIYADELFFIEDPHELYKHWSADAWQAIEQHQMKPGMNELQASFALGMGTPEQSDDSEKRVVNYPNGGHPVTVTYRGGKATRIDAPTQSAAGK
jgi:hypothetical protein